MATDGGNGRRQAAGVRVHVAGRLGTSGRPACYAFNALDSHPTGFYDADPASFYLSFFCGNSMRHSPGFALGHVLVLAGMTGACQSDVALVDPDGAADGPILFVVAADTSLARDLAWPEGVPD